VAIFPGGGDTADEIHQVDVEERRAGLEAVHHRRAVDLGEDVILQVELRVVLQRAVDDVGLCAALPGGDGLGENVLEVGRSLNNSVSSPLSSDDIQTGSQSFGG